MSVDISVETVAVAVISSAVGVEEISLQPGRINNMETTPIQNERFLFLILDLFKFSLMKCGNVLLTQFMHNEVNNFPNPT